MRFLVDSCVSASVCSFLRREGHYVVWVPDAFPSDPGDETIIDMALETGRILITGDKDFGEWIFLRGKTQPPLIRLAAMAPANHVRILHEVLKTHAVDLENGALITATRDRLRVRRADE